MIPAERRVAAGTLEGFAVRVLETAGARSEDARAVAGHLVGSDLAGHDGHGAALLPDYVRDARAGLVATDAADRVVNETPVLIQLDAQGGWGAPAANRLIDRAAGKAKAGGLAAASLAQAHHLGRIGAFGERAADAGLAALIFVNVTGQPPLMAPYRGSDARFGSNPLCIAFPAAGERPAFVLDMATSRIAPETVRSAARRGVDVPPNCLIDPRGMPTTDPTGLAGPKPQGALSPFGRHKGYGLAFACEFLAGILSGSGTIQPDNPRKGAALNGLFAVLIDPAAFGDRAWMEREIEAMTDYVLGSPPMEWDTPVLLPGDPERAFTGKRQREGIPLDEATLAALNTLAAELGLEERL